MPVLREALLAPRLLPLFFELERRFVELPPPDRLDRPAVRERLELDLLERAFDPLRLEAAPRVLLRLPPLLRVPALERLRLELREDLDELRFFDLEELRDPERDLLDELLPDPRELLLRPLLPEEELRRELPEPPEPARFPTAAPTIPPTTAPTGPAILPTIAPVAAPAACLDMGGN